MNVKEFIKLEETQQLLVEEKMNNIIVKWLAESGGANVRPLKQFFNNVGVNMLDYMTFIPMGYYYFESEEVVRVPSNIKFIQTDAFYKCKTLKEIWIPTSVEKIMTDAFFDCINLNAIHYGGTINEFKSITEYEFSNIPITVICRDGTFDVDTLK